MHIDVQHIYKSFGSRRILEDLCLSVKTGERFVIMGRSGSGKTTLLRLIAGLEDPRSGIIRLGDTTVFGNGARVEPHARCLSLIFQEPALWPHLTVAQNCEIVVRRIVRNKPDRYQRIREILRDTQILEMADKYPHTLSAGEKQRASLARALITQPRILLLDEPLNYLDIHLKEEIINLILQTHEERGITLLYVTHEPDEALLLNTTVGILDGGHIAATGDASSMISLFRSNKRNGVGKE